MTFGLATDKDYKAWLAEIKLRIRTVQIKAAVAVNSELLRFYWSLGAEIVVKQMTAKWGDGLLSQLSLDLMAEFPEMKGFSKRNLELVRQWYLFYGQAIVPAQFAKQPVSQMPGDIFGHEIVAQIIAIPWGHNKPSLPSIEDIERELEGDWS